MPPVPGECPVCTSRKCKNISPSMYYCGRCRIVFNADHRSEEYGEDYFVSDYRAQYGKTYEEDFDAIYASSWGRLDRILSMAARSGELREISLLDIGAALGFFLKCARDKGIGRVRGIEISGFASRYCRERFSIPVDAFSFPENKPEGTFDIITAWYFIEHTPSPVDAMRTIFSMLNRGGVFAFSAPSIWGPMFQFHRKEWIQEHPTDHRIDFSPKGIKEILMRIGFAQVKVFTSGFHPERIVPSSSVFYRPFRAAYGMLTRRFPFSDTIEIYAVK